MISRVETTKQLESQNIVSVTFPTWFPTGVENMGGPQNLMRGLKSKQGRELKILSKNACEGVHLIVKLPVTVSFGRVFFEKKCKMGGGFPHASPIMGNSDFHTFAFRSVQNPITPIGKTLSGQVYNPHFVLILIEQSNSNLTST